MDYTDYIDRTQRAANFVQNGMYDEAVALLKGLVEAEISGVEKAQTEEH